MLTKMQTAFIHAAVGAAKDVSTKHEDKAPVARFKRQFVESVKMSADRIKIRVGRDAAWKSQV